MKPEEFFKDIVETYEVSRELNEEVLYWRRRFLTSKSISNYVYNCFMNLPSQTMRKDGCDDVLQHFLELEKMLNKANPV